MQNQLDSDYSAIKANQQPPLGTYFPPPLLLSYNSTPSPHLSLTSNASCKVTTMVFIHHLLWSNGIITIFDTHDVFLGAEATGWWPRRQQPLSVSSRLSPKYNNNKKGDGHQNQQGSMHKYHHHQTLLQSSSSMLFGIRDLDTTTIINQRRRRRKYLSSIVATSVAIRGGGSSSDDDVDVDGIEEEPQVTNMISNKTKNIKSKKKNKSHIPEIYYR